MSDGNLATPLPSLIQTGRRAPSPWLSEQEANEKAPSS